MEERIAASPAHPLCRLRLILKGPARGPRGLAFLPSPPTCALRRRGSRSVRERRHTPINREIPFAPTCRIARSAQKTMH